MALQYSTAHRSNSMTQLNTDLGSNAVLTLYAGTPPTNVGAALAGGNNVLASGPCNAAGFGTVAAGVLTSSAIASLTVTGAGTQTATFYRLANASGPSPVVQGTVGTSGADLNIVGGASLTNGQTLTIANGALTFTANGA